MTVASALRDPSLSEGSGAHPSLAPRLGVEWEPVRRLLHVRAGYYLEPSRTGSRPRSHATFGGEVRVPFWPLDLQVGLAGDLAERYQNVGLSLGFFSDLGPVPPVSHRGPGH